MSLATFQVNSTSTQSRPERVAERARDALDDGSALSGPELAKVKTDIAKAPGIMRPMLTKTIDDPNAVKAGMLRWAPRMLVALLPAYAAILALFCRRRNYPEHLYFAIHLHSFVFAALTLANLFKFSHVFVIGLVTGLAASAWIVLYSLIALRRVYGGTIGGTLARAIGIMTLYGVVALPALLGVVLLSAFLRSRAPTGIPPVWCRC
ncbi:MAG TPA: hypothetical protein VFT29_19780 [Gemmatimonadaceae bacterium]|nr:hypothetical protein [Gemmatimonadaceae bacterium]